MSNEELKEAKRLLKILKSDDWYKEDYTDQALDIIREYDEYNNFIDEEILDEMVKQEAKSGAVRLMFFLAKAEPSPVYGWMVDGYGNIDNVKLEDIIVKLEDIIKEQGEE